MLHDKPVIVFFGTPDFAVGSLKAVTNAGYRVACVVTAPDKPAGRGRKITSSPVKDYALRHHLKILQPVKLKDPGFLEELRKCKADLQVVVAFRMLPAEVWKLPPLGTFNLHASLLPDYRGAAPINWAIINGETRTGVTTFRINEDIDTGDILMKAETEILINDTAGSLHDRLMEMGSRLVVSTIEGITVQKINPLPQNWLVNPGELKTAPKIRKEDCRINWNKNTNILYNFIRGLSPYPGAWTELTDTEGNRLVLKIYFADEINRPPSGLPGTVETDGKKYFRIATADGYLEIRSLQMQGKKILGAEEFVRGLPKGSEYKLA